jgi:hypothetical protein
VRWRILATLALAAFASCGAPHIDRPLPIEIKGLSSRATKLILGVYPKSAMMSCQQTTVENVAMLTPPYHAEWDRESGADRTLELPTLDTDGVTIIAYSKDINSVTIQFACQYIEYKDLGGTALEASNGVLVLTLSQRM